MRNMSYFTRKTYTEPLVEGSFKVTPALDVPKHIIRPSYVGRRNQQFSDLSTMPILQHDKEAVDRMRNSAKLASSTLSWGMAAAKIGATTNDIDKAVHDHIISHDAYPTPIDYMHFPKSVCTTVNEVLCHGIPDDRPLLNGDYVNIDVTWYLDGHHGDNSAMVMVGEVHQDIQNLIRVTREAMYKAIEICKPGVQYNTIGEVINTYAIKHGYVVWPHFTGHGIGEELHCGPFVYHVPNTVTARMQVGNVFTIEPIIMLHDGNDMIYEWRDGWTILAQNTPSAQWEHTIAITEDGFEILTLREGEERPDFQ
jgi:methionyl aminopeptidase